MDYDNLYQDANAAYNYILHANSETYPTFPRESSASIPFPSDEEWFKMEDAVRDKILVNLYRRIKAGEKHYQEVMDHFSELDAQPKVASPG